ncbi:MAG: helix-turn-helix transcriptional regulator [Bacteroidales bacterium]|nr:helix-turn-helix transcriptional regulator [Bacteroidales bacterium]
MKFVYEKIDVSHGHSFITRSLKMDPDSDKIHFHKNFELNYISSGSGRRIVGSHISSYTPGDLVLLGPNISHCWEVMEPGDDGHGECIVTHFYENIFASDFFNIPELNEVVMLLKEADSGIRFLGTKTRKVAESLKKMVHMKGLERYIELLKVFNMLLRIEEREFLALPSSLPDSYDKDREQIDKIYEYVFQNIQNEIKLSDAAELVYMEPSSFCRYFKKKTSRTFIDYVKNVRIGMAARLLAETDKQITQICYDCGYNNLANFNHYFKQIMKKTPSEYRKAFRE